MSTYEGYEDDIQDEWLSKYIEEELRQLAEAPAFDYLAHHGDAIEERVRNCLTEAHSLRDAGFPGAGLVRATAGIEIAIRFFLARPLLHGAFLSNEWARLLSNKVLNGRTAEDRELLPAILRNWKIDITAVKLRNGDQLWETIITRVWQRRNDYVHKGEVLDDHDAELALESLAALLDEVVARVANRLGFTREESRSWSVVIARNPPEFPDLNPPHRYERQSPF
ncbi:MAG: hypothetical protein HY238_21195 [Acidobacteria bacterium]|nr:hypothetical protein [Acidobacteriota bacterium]